MKRVVPCPACGLEVVMEPETNTIRHASPVCDEFTRRVEASGLKARRENWSAYVNVKTGEVVDVQVTTHESPGARHIREYEQQAKEAHRIPDSACPGCGAAMDYATASEGSPQPKPGDPGVCTACGTLIVLDEQLQKRRMTEVELAAFDADQRQELREVSAIYRGRALVRPSKAPGQA